MDTEKSVLTCYLIRKEMHRTDENVYTVQEWKGRFVLEIALRHRNGKYKMNHGYEKNKVN